MSFWVTAFDGCRTRGAQTRKNNDNKWREWERALEKKFQYYDYANVCNWAWPGTTWNANFTCHHRLCVSVACQQSTYSNALFDSFSQIIVRIVRILNHFYVNAPYTNAFSYHCTWGTRTNVADKLTTTTHSEHWKYHFYLSLLLTLSLETSSDFLFVFPITVYPCVCMSAVSVLFVSFNLHGNLF